MNLEILSTSNAAPGEEGAEIPPNVAADTTVEGNEHTIRLSGNHHASTISTAKDRAEIRSLLMQGRSHLASDAEAVPERAPQPQPQPQEEVSFAGAGKNRVQGKKHVMQTGKTFVVRHVP